jgi:predicted NUDIX family phosphoesterase
VVERVLVLPRTAVPGGVGFTGIRTLDTASIGAFRRGLVTEGTWMGRTAAEQDPTHKQVIPYVVARDRSEAVERVFLMERTDAGRDPRLHRKATIGIGGHLNPVDGDTDPLEAGLRREWREELVTDWEPEFQAIGLLNDDGNSVGSVHLGVVFVVEAAGRGVEVREREKLSGRMVPVEELALVWERLETWSQLVAEALWGRPSA